MYHAHFRGTHYEAGFRWGSLLFEHNKIILEQVPFPITRERMDYARDWRLRLILLRETPRPLLKWKTA